MLVQINPVENGDPAGPNLWNDRFAAVVKTVNGNIEGDNIKDRGIPRAKIDLDAIGSDELAPESILPSHTNNVWVGKSVGKAPVTTSYFSVFNKTVNLSEAAYIYVLYTASGNANNTSVDPEVRILVNDVAVESFSGQGGLELFTAKANADFPFAASGITTQKQSGAVNVKVQVKSSNTDGWDCGNGFVRIDALGDNSYLG